ncbi:MAG: cytochrome b, partial [Acidimicrobiales bacterium]
MAVRDPLADPVRFIDERTAASPLLRKSLRYLFPDHWSFLLGEVAIYCFVVLIATGTYHALFYDPSTAKTVYHGAYAPLDGQLMSGAYKSVVTLSLSTQAGLLMRQTHHWAADLFMASIVIHLMRVFFTGAFRKPRELNWLIGLGLMTLGIVEGFAGYSLPDDLLSGTGLRIADAIMLSIPIVVTWISFLVFGGPFPGDLILGRLYIVHVFLIPALLAALIGAHLALVVRQKHTQFPQPGRTEHQVSGERVFPIYAAKAGGFFFIVFGACAALGGLAQINPVWLYGPYNPAQVSSGSQPDFYMMFLD